MKRFFSAVALCFALLIGGLFIFLPYAKADVDPVIMLLTLPAPPPPNPLVKQTFGFNTEKYLDKTKQPDDNAPIEELMAYWQTQNGLFNNMSFNAKPSERVLSRLRAEIEKKPEILTNFLNILPENQDTAGFIKRIYESKLNEEPDEENYQNEQVERWLFYHSDHKIEELAKAAAQAADVNNYVSNQEELLALARVDWERARPILERLYNDSSQPVSQTLARWALYNHALATDSIGDIDKYRDELKRVVEDKSALPGNRDLAMDALVKEKDWDGRDDWYFSLLEDETLYELKVNGVTYTGLTTLIANSPPDKYVAKMLELVKNSNPTIRNAAVRNLITALDKENKNIVTALLPWLENPKWAKEVSGERRRLVDMLQNMEIPESVPGLIAMLNEKAATDVLQPNANTAARAINSNTVYSPEFINQEFYPYRSAAINALAKQKDGRAVSPLRLILPELGDWERNNGVRALLVSNGFSIGEQIEALESVALSLKNVETQRAAIMAANTLARTAANAAVRSEDIEIDEESGDTIITAQTRISVATAGAANMASNATLYVRPNRQFTNADIKPILGLQLVNLPDPSEALLNALIERINVLDKRDAGLAMALRKIIQNWSGTAVNALLLKDLKNGKTDADAIVKLLSLRKKLRENQANDVYEVRNGNATAVGISACLIEDNNEYDALLASENTAAKTAMLACARLIRAKLPVQKVAANLQSTHKMLALSAELYLESEDSPEARSIILARYPNQAKILGATMFFGSDKTNVSNSQFLAELFASVANSDASAPFYYFYGYFEEIRNTEKRLQKEVKESKDLLGVYAYENNFVRIYADKAVFSWEEDEARYRERILETEEFNNLKSFLAYQRVDELAPFLSYCEGCEGKELLMLGKQGGRRVFVKTAELPEFFVELEKIFESFQQPPAKLRYQLEKDIAGLEILFADKNLQANTVWKNGEDLRVLLIDEESADRIEKELSKQERLEEESENFDYEKAVEIRRKRREERAYDSFSWQRFDGEKLSEIVAQPEKIEFIPLRDGSAISPEKEQWKSRTPNFEIRTDEQGLYKVTRGQVSKLRDGYYYTPFVTPNGRWAIVSKYDEKSNLGTSLVRLNLTTNKEFVVKTTDFPINNAIAFLPSLNKVLIASGYYGEEDDEGLDSSRVQTYFLLDVETGAITPAKGEFRPLVQQTFRPLQSTANADEFWAVIPDERKNQTAFGVYNTKTFTFKEILKIPKITFNSMQMWYDEPAKKLYFTYEGHLLALTLPKS